MLTQKETFVQKARVVHGDKYAYDHVEYVDNRTKVSITCPIHGVFMQEPSLHVNRKCGCFKCAVDLRKKATSHTTDIFLDKAKAVHGERYDYSNVVYVNSTTPVVIRCQEHGEFQQIPNSHLLGRGCPRCGGKVQLTTAEFVAKAKAVHGDKYDYTPTNYVTAKVPVKIVCRKHGVFEQIPGNHTNGSGCYSCMPRIILSTDEYLERAKAVHGDLYDYSKVAYVDAHTHITIGCKKHGDFEQPASEHTRGRGCKRCADEYLGKLNTLSTDVFVDNAKAIHGDKYDYSNVAYVTTHTPVKIVCSKHGVFEQKPASHMKGSGCHTCSSSKGEIAVAKILKKHGIAFTQEYAIPNQGYGYRYDFHVPSLNLLIEYHGIQHHQPVEYFGGEAGLAATRLRDDMKRTLAKSFGYKFLEVSYTQFLNLSEEAFEKKLLLNLKRFGFLSMVTIP